MIVDSLQAEDGSPFAWAVDHKRETLKTNLSGLLSEVGFVEAEKSQRFLAKVVLAHNSAFSRSKDASI